MNFLSIQVIFRGGTSALNIGYYSMSHLSPIGYTDVKIFILLKVSLLKPEYRFNVQPQTSDKFSVQSNNT